MNAFTRLWRWFWHPPQRASERAARKHLDALQAELRMLQAMAQARERR